MVKIKIEVLVEEQLKSLKKMKEMEIMDIMEMAIIQILKKKYEIYI